MSPKLTLIGIIVWFLSGGCLALDHPASAPPRFPDRQEIEQLELSAPPSDEEVFGDVGIDISHWNFDGLLPSIVNSDEGYRGQNLAGSALLKSIRKHGYGYGLKATKGMGCVAHQAGWFHLKNGGPPSSTLTEYMAARCGAGVTLVGIGSIVLGPEAKSLTTSDLQQGTDSFIAAIHQKGATRAFLGAWAGWLGARFVMTFAVGMPTVLVDNFVMDAQGRVNVMVRGKMLDEVMSVEGLVGIGDRDFATCQNIDGSPPGDNRFALQCPIDPDDSVAFIDLVVNERRRVLASKAMTLFVSPDGTMPNFYSEPILPLLANGDPTDPSYLARIVDDIRMQKGLEPLGLELEQSERIERLLPHYFAASRSISRAELADSIMLHIIGGDDVSGLLRDSNFLSFGLSLSGGVPLSRALSMQLMFPMARSVLLDPEADLSAFGLRLSESKEGAAVIVATYDRLESDHHLDTEVRLLEELDHARAIAGYERIERMNDARSSAVLDRALGQLTGGLSPDVVFREMADELNLAHPDSSARYSYQFLERDEEANISWPDELVEHGEQAMVRIGQHRVPNSNWGLELVVVVYTLPAL